MTATALTKLDEARETDPPLRVTLSAGLGVDLRGYSERFRDAVLGRAPSERMCYVVSGPLCAAIVALGHGARLVKNKVAYMEHIFIRLDDGRVLDATADQFAHLADVGPVYLGEPIKRLHGGWKVWRGGHSWLALIRGFERLQPDLDAAQIGKMIRQLYETMPGDHQFSAAFGGHGWKTPNAELSGQAGTAQVRSNDR